MLSILRSNNLFLCSKSPSEVVSGMPNVGIGGDGTGTPDIDLAFQHPDGASAEEGGVGLIILQPSPSEMDGERLEEEEEEEEEEDESDVEAVSPSPPQPLTTPPPGLGLILEGMDAHLQHRMAFLRGRESSGSQDSLLVEVNRSREALEDSRVPFNIDGETDPQVDKFFQMKCLHWFVLTKSCHTFSVWEDHHHLRLSHLRPRTVYFGFIATSSGILHLPHPHPPPLKCQWSRVANQVMAVVVAVVWAAKTRAPMERVRREAVSL